jgi:hypothetical protein
MADDLDPTALAAAYDEIEKMGPLEYCEPSDVAELVIRAYLAAAPKNAIIAALLADVERLHIVFSETAGAQRENVLKQALMRIHTLATEEASLVISPWRQLTACADIAAAELDNLAAGWREGDGNG